MKEQYKYNLGDIVHVNRGKIKILEHIRMKNGKSTRKGYLYECLSCGYIGEKTENNMISKTGCLKCEKMLHKYANEYKNNNIWSTNPNIAKLLADPNDGYKYTQGSKRKVDWICPDCGTIIKNKTIKNIKNQGLFCPMCYDGFSYPNKFLYNILTQLKVNFVSEKKFDWLKNKKYDFYLYDENYIIEVNGIQHYEEFNKNNWKTLNEEQENDRFKKETALKNGIIKYIIIDAKESNLDYIKNSILKSELNNLFDLSNINWLICEQLSSNNLIKMVCHLWNNNFGTVSHIGKELKIHRLTVRRYLSRGTKIGWCNYNPQTEKEKQYKSVSKKVINITTGAIYNSGMDAFRETGISNSTISKCCLGKYQLAGNYKWMFLDDYLGRS